jgi:hypothetical protein
MFFVSADTAEDFRTELVKYLVDQESRSLTDARIAKLQREKEYHNGAHAKAKSIRQFVEELTIRPTKKVES